MHVLERSVPITPEGVEELELEVALLEQCRRQIASERVASLPASIVGALDRESLAVDEQISLLRETLALGELVENTGLLVGIGSEVSLEAEYGQVTFTISGPIAATPRRGSISYDSPLGHALLGAELGGWVEVPWEGSQRRLKVTGIRRGKPGSGA